MPIKASSLYAVNLHSGLQDVACVSLPLSDFPWQLPCGSLQLFRASWPLRRSKLLWKQLVLFGSFFFFACTQNCMTCYNSLFMLSVRALSCFGRWSKKRRPRSTETNLPGCLSWQALWICAALKFITPTYRETNKQPNLRLPEPQLQRAVALLTFTAQCFSYPSSSPLFFFLLSCLKANNFLISKVVSTSLGGNVLKDEGRCQG